MKRRAEVPHVSAGLSDHSLSAVKRSPFLLRQSLSFLLSYLSRSPLHITYCTVISSVSLFCNSLSFRVCLLVINVPYSRQHWYHPPQWLLLVSITCRRIAEHRIWYTDYSEQLRTTVTDLLKINHPVILAGMNVAAGPKLAAAVTNAGGLGVIGGVGYTPDMLREQVAELKSYLVDKNAPFGVDLLLPQVGGSARKTK